MKKNKPEAGSRKLGATKVKPELPGGFRDYGPADAILRQRLLEKIRKTFEDFGFDPMETPAVERTEVLTGGEGESQKIIFGVTPSTSSGNKDRIKTSLRFDLTVPLARFIAANPEIPKPFKRYQIGASWRGESPQVGRYREFLQADIDIIGSSSTEAESEIITAVYQFLKNIGLNRFLIKINNRKILNGLPDFAGFPQKKLKDVLRIVDKTEKIGSDAVDKELAKAVGKKNAEKIKEFLANPKVAEEDPNVRDGFKELREVAENLKNAGVDNKNYIFDYTIVRGLDYYTGAVFETVLLDAKDMGSIASGGRYDNLVVPFTGEKIPAVGISIGVDRLYAALEKLNFLKKKSTTLKVLILNLSPSLKKEYWELASRLRSSNINTAIYLGDDRAFQAQLAYAVKKEIPYVIIYGEEEKQKGVVAVKNLITREQREISKDKLVEHLKK